MMVDGKAAETLALLARQRWCRAIGKGEPKLDPAGDPWPVDVAPRLHEPRHRHCTDSATVHGRERGARGRAAVPRFDRSGSAHIYIENQFTTSTRIAAASCPSAARRTRELEVVIVAPHAHELLLESRTMRNGRIRFWRTVQAAGGPRVRLVAPEVTKDSGSA